ncbi:MAG TPA: bifunctional diguanylate cyclase/phosphodiesterase [Candidatus Deferrimicrobiaceae bacterium]|nr:bifunctional diguanylate cyclase/phosphodiesterase [Candidatus Deferrimicrobiaceae bacterium]
MHVEPIHDLAHDPILDGRDSLRIVRLRLALTLITVALLPIAAFAPIVRAVSGDATLAHHLRLDTDAGTVASKLAVELGAVAALSESLLDDPAVVDAAAADPLADASAAASARLSALVRRSSGAVSGASLVAGRVVRAAWGQPLDLRRLPPEPKSGLLPGTGASAGTVLVVAAAAATKNWPSRALVVTVDLDALLAWATPATALAGRVVELMDPEGEPIAEARGAFDPAMIPGQVLDLATDTMHRSEGEAVVLAPGLEGWSVTATAPLPLADLPGSAVAALAAVLLVLVGLTIWMARQILRPAAQLEASRSRLRELYESAREAALRDSLTGLGNHRSFQEALERMVEVARRYGTPFALVLFDVDEFKRINDSQGHAVGDQLLAELGDLIRATVRHADAGYRVGGDEFAILLPHTDADGAAVMTRRLLGRALEGRGQGFAGPISFSAGITACPEFGTTRLALTSQADAALYRGKRGGRTLVTVFDPVLDHGHVDEGMRAELSSAISMVIEAGMLRPVYQPIVDLATGVIAGYEGLVRVPPESTFPQAGAMFDAAEVSGRVVDLDRAALDVVLAGARDLDPTLSISLNVSPRTLEAEEFNATVVQAILRRHGIPPGRVILELTERQAARDPDRLAGAIRELQAAGVRVAADDVGAGNAGLRLLTQFRFDVVKIDLSLVQGSGQDQGLSVLTSLVQMAGRLGAVTIAEGVETVQQLATIRRLGVSAGQGHLLGRPQQQHPPGRIDLIALSDPAPVEDQPAEPGASPRTRSMVALNTSNVSKE